MLSHWSVLPFLCAVAAAAYDAAGFYDLKATTLTGQDFSFDLLKGKVALIVNVASMCGFTESTYTGLVRLHNILSYPYPYPYHFTVLAFPCNQFGEQEPGDSDDIALLAQNYKVEFPIFSKIDVLGEDTHPVYKNIIGQSGVLPEWNFYKYLVSHEGEVLKVWGAKDNIEDMFDEVEVAVNKAREADENSGSQSSAEAVKEAAQAATQKTKEELSKEEL